MRLAIGLALPFPLMAIVGLLGGALSFSPWNYWYALLLPVMCALATACVANADARTRNVALLSSGAPLGGQWWAKALYCLGLVALANAVVLAVYACAAWAAGGFWLAPAAAATMLAAALTNVVTCSWMIPAGLFLTARCGMLAGIFLPLLVQLACGFAWSLVPLPQLFPPTASMVLPTAFLPVLPSGEPLAADMALGAALTPGMWLVAAGLAVSAAAFLALAALGARWAARSEEVRR